jgi:Tfp pilus assembly protein PilF
MVERVLEQFGLTDRLLAITTDNASNNGTMREVLQQALSGHHNLIWDAEVAKVSCLAHVLNTSAKSLLLGVKIAKEREDDYFIEVEDQDPFNFVPDIA